VVGAGLVGTSIAFQLARRGDCSVLLVDRGSVGGGDSSRCFGMVRRHYSNDVTVRLAVRGIELIRTWPDAVGTGDSGYVPTGYLMTATPDREAALRANVERLRGLGVDTQVVEVDELTELEPLLSHDGIAVAAYERDGGFADAQRMTLSWFAAAVRAGARAHLGARVARILVNRGRVTGVDTDAGRIDTNTVVDAAGAWGAELAATAGVTAPISLRRVQVAEVAQRPDGPQLRVTFSDMASNLVMRPDRAGRALAVAYQPEQLVAKRDDCDPTLDRGYEASLRGALAKRVPAYRDATLAGGFAGAYDYTPDWNPILGWSPVAGLYLALGWSGHGFKLAPSVGEVVADELTGKRPTVDVSELGLERFERGFLLRLAYGPGARA
jgi:glycine/D-amino acid oxidase-like deaminating enzyme